MTRYSLLFFAFALFTLPGFSQGLVKEEAPDQFRIDIAPAIPDNLHVGVLRLSTDSLVTSRWNSVIKSFDKLEYLKRNDLITQQEYLDNKARLTMEIQKIKAIKSPKVFEISADK